MKISVISPVLNEVDFIGYSAMSALPYVHEVLYGVADSRDGTVELLNHLAGSQPNLSILRGEVFEFDPMDLKAYNAAYNALIEEAAGDHIWFLHPDMIVTNPEAIRNIPQGPALAYFTHVNSYAKDLKTEIVSGRTKRWKNIHANRFGLHYYGGYGSANEDFYHRDITGDSYRHYGDDFAEYPFEVADSGVRVNHYCELKSYERRLEKMKRCLKTQNPNLSEEDLEKFAKSHPRVTLDTRSKAFGNFEFANTKEPIPSVFEKYGEEFGQFKKEIVRA